MLNSTIQAIALFPFQTITYKTEKKKKKLFYWYQLYCLAA